LESLSRVRFFGIGSLFYSKIMAIFNCFIPVSAQQIRCFTCIWALSGLSIQFAFAQYNTDLSSPKVDWAALIDVALPTNGDSDNADNQMVQMQLLRLNATDQLLAPYISINLSERLWELAKNEDWELFEDAELTRPTDFETILARITAPDTVLTFDPVTYEERASICLDCKVLPFEATQVVARQLLMYHNASASFSLQTLAIGICDNEGSPMYWLKIPELVGDYPSDLDSDPDVIWAARYITRQDSPFPEDAKMLKNNTGELLPRFLDRVRLDTSIELYDEQFRLVQPEQRPRLFSRTDTLVMFDPGNWTEKTIIVDGGLDEEEVEQLGLVQVWYWHDTDNMLYTRLIAVAPRYEVAAEQNEKKISKAGFFRLCLNSGGP
jgi:hypothetical protein